MTDIANTEIPSDARRPLEYLAERLSMYGFEKAGKAAEIDVSQPFGQRILVVPFLHPEERCLFVMGIRSRLAPRSDLVLHLITQLDDGRRVETSTLGALARLPRPDDVDLRSVVDAETVEEIWSRHRRALTEYKRSSRHDIQRGGWKKVLSQTYEAWLGSALRAQKLALNRDGQTYRLRRAE